LVAQLVGGDGAPKRVKNPRGMEGKERVFSLVERGGRVRSHHIPDVSAKNLRSIVINQVKRCSHVMTDDGASVRAVGGLYENHQSVNHSIGEYVRGDAHTNTIEGYFSILKRGAGWRLGEAVDVQTGS
jgi:hypothetical protein